MLNQKNIQGLLVEAGLSETVAAMCAVRILSLALPAQTDTVKTAISALSHSELTAVLAAFNVLEGEAGIIIAAKIAESAGVPKTTVANAFRKLEGAAMIETRSLGAKGTFVKIINMGFLKELRKFD